MAVAVILGGRDGNGVLEAALFEVLGHLRCVQLRLLARLGERINALDGHAERNHRHDDQNHANGLRDPAHLLPHMHQVHCATPPVLDGSRRISNVTTNGGARGPALIADTWPAGGRTKAARPARRRHHCSVKFTVSVMMTGTGTPFSSVGVNCHCLTASSAAWSSSGIERRTLASLTRPSGPIVASMMTTPCTRADWAFGG